MCLKIVEKIVFDFRRVLKMDSMLDSCYYIVEF